MGNLLQYRAESSLGASPGKTVTPRGCAVLLLFLVALFTPSISRAQSAGDSTPNALELGPRCPTCPIVIAAHPISEKDKEERSERSTQKKDFRVANARRKLYIDDETNKMLILARDLKAKIDGLGAEHPTAIMQREAAMIEFLAKDIKEKMKLTVNPD